MTYEISPSTLKNVVDTRFGCHRCFWLKVKHDVRPPSSDGLGLIHSQIHDWFFELITSQWLDLLPPGKLVLTEEWLRARPVNEIQLFGRVDGVIELDTGGYGIIDLKTISSPDKRQWTQKNHGLQVNAYRFMLEQAEDGYPNLTPVDVLGIVTFCPDRFAVRHNDAAGIAGDIRWHAIPSDNAIVGRAIGEAQAILSQDVPPAGNENCEWCDFYRRWGDPWERVK